MIFFKKITKNTFKIRDRFFRRPAIKSDKIRFCDDIKLVGLEKPTIYGAQYAVCVFGEGIQKEFFPYKELAEAENVYDWMVKYLQESER